MRFKKNPVIAIVGLGYVGLPLAIEFSRKFKTIGFDVNSDRIKELKKGYDNTLEISKDTIDSAVNLKFTNQLEELKNVNVYIVTVPTPIDKHKRPCLTPLIKASEMLGQVINRDNIVVYESTVYPGATEEDCIPLIEKESGLVFNHDFFAGYSPERINPGDKEHRVTTIKKITSGSTAEVADYVDYLYNSIITAGTHKVSSIRVAEAAKVIENTQRDLNIALINELAMIFHKLEIDTEEVLKAAGTKWNFLPFRPGLVGGHCIGVDPYYLTYKAEEIGYHPEVILAGRHINDGMGKHIVTQIVKKMIKRRIHIEDSNVLIMGLTFKENCPDLRNTRVIDMVSEFQGYGANVDVYDPWVNSQEAENEYGIIPVKDLAAGKYEAIVLAVAHDQFKRMQPETIRKLGRRDCVIYDIKYILPPENVDGRL